MSHVSPQYAALAAWVPFTDRPQGYSEENVSIECLKQAHLLYKGNPSPHEVFAFATVLQRLSNL